MSKKKKVALGLFILFIAVAAAFLVWLVLPYPSCGDDQAQISSYYSEKLGVYFMYPSSLCVLEPDKPYILELSRNKVPSNFYGEEGYEMETLKETLRIRLGFRLHAQSFEGKISFRRLFSQKGTLIPSEFFRRIMKDRFIVLQNTEGTTYVLEVFPEEQVKNTRSYAEIKRARMFSDKLKKAIAVSQGAGISDEEFSIVVNSLKFGE